MNLMTHRIGIDFDNTIASYDEVFYKAALEKNLIPKEIFTAKGSVRDYLRIVSNEDAWTELQGYIYGARMDLAQAYPGVSQFLSRCHAKEIPAFIISHKTLYPFLGPKYDLHMAARNWLNRQPFSWIPPVFFELTLQEKLKRIALQGCTVFIDDLPELLANKDFPSHVQKVLFDPHRLHPQEGNYLYATSWDEISRILQVSTTPP